MATRSLPRHRIRAERVFFTGMAVTMALIALIGFAPTYYFASAFHAPPLVPLAHLHGMVFSGWMILYLVQNGLVFADRRDLHRWLGSAGAGLALVVLVLGVWIAIDSGHNGRGTPGRDQPTFLINPLVNIAWFAALAAAAVWRRAEAAAHKRLMLLATIALVTTPLARISRMLGWTTPPPIGGMILSDVLLLALIVFDLRQRGRLHPVTLWVGGAFFVSQPLRVAFSRTEAWQSIAHAMLA